MDNIHAVLEDGRTLVGVPVFAEAYRRADLPVLAWLFSRTSADFLPSWGGRLVADAPPLDTARVRQIGLMIADRTFSTAGCVQIAVSDLQYYLVPRFLQSTLP